MSRMFLETMIRRRSGHIMNLSSMASYHAIPGGIVYTTTKFAVRGFSEALDQELRLDGFGNYIHVTAVHPYFVATRKDLMDCAAKLRFVEFFFIPSQNQFLFFYFFIPIFFL